MDTAVLQDGRVCVCSRARGHETCSYRCSLISGRCFAVQLSLFCEEVGCEKSRKMTDCGQRRESNHYR